MMFWAGRFNIMFSRTSLVFRTAFLVMLVVIPCVSMQWIPLNRTLLLLVMVAMFILRLRLVSFCSLRHVRNKGLPLMP